MSLDLFKDWIPSILQTKQNVIKDALDEKSYEPFMINRALSLHQDCLFPANEMNRMYHLPKVMQYHYLLGTVRGRKRPFIPWPKKTSNENMSLLMKHFNYSRGKALQALSIMTEDQIDELKKMYEHI